MEKKEWYLKYLSYKKYYKKYFLEQAKLTYNNLK